MAISFETDFATVLLPETAPVLFDPERARQAIKRDANIRRCHLGWRLECFPKVRARHCECQQTNEQSFARLGKTSRGNRRT
jgi:hypothetical protein